MLTQKRPSSSNGKLVIIRSTEKVSQILGFGKTNLKQSQRFQEGKQVKHEYSILLAQMVIGKYQL